MKRAINRTIHRRAVVDGRSRFGSLAVLLTSLLATAIAEASPDAATDIRGFIEGLDAGDVPAIAGRTLVKPDILIAVYRARDHEPLWLRGAPLERQVRNLLAAIDESAGHGFVPERYHQSAIDRLLQAADAKSKIALELLLTDAFLAQAVHRGQGAISPPNLDAEWGLPPPEFDAGAILVSIAKRRRSVATELESLWPSADEYRQLVRRRAEILASGDETTVQVPTGPLLKPGQTNDRVLMLKERLMGPGEHSPLYDDDLLREVKAIQRVAGLEPDGIVGDKTLEILNATRVSWIERIDANLERWRWLPREAPDDYIRVNIAAFTLRAIENGREQMQMNVIVGQPYRRTPVFTETIKYLVFNPYWNVPFSIATKDKLPALKANAAAEAGKGFDAKPQGSDVFVPVDAIDWQGVTPRTFNYLLRQRPGDQNALGKVKFMLPNPYSVYLHDTPGRDLFARQERSFSSGCIRLERPLELAEWLLRRERHPEAGKASAIVATRETRTIYLKKPLPTYIVYFTAFELDGDIVFRRDIYDRDRPIVAALRAQGT